LRSLWWEMVQQRLVVVMGATGMQGGSIVNTLLAEKWHGGIRALTRDVTKPKAQELASKGVELFKADLKDKESLCKAFQGATTAFVVTDTYDPSTKETDEAKQGINAVEAAKECGVQHLILSSLEDMEKTTNGKYLVKHFTDKHRVQERAEQLQFPLLTIVEPGFYWQNLFTYFPMQELPDGSRVLALPCKASTLVPGLDICDFGGVVAKIMQDPERFNRLAIPIAAEYVTFAEVVRQLSLHLGVPVRFREISIDEAKASHSSPFSDEWIEMFRAFEEFDYYGKKADLTLANSLCHLKTLEEFLRSRRV